MNDSIIKGSLEHSSMRSGLISTIEDLSNKDYQMKKWIHPGREDGFWYDLKMVMEFLEDICLMDSDSNGEGQIGYTIRSREELKIVMVVIKLLDRVFDEIGPRKPDSAYLNSPLWEEVVQAANQAYEYIKNQGLDDEYFKRWAKL